MHAVGKSERVLFCLLSICENDVGQDPDALIGAMEAFFQPLLQEFSWIMDASNPMYGRDDTSPFATVVNKASLRHLDDVPWLDPTAALMDNVSHTGLVDIET